MIAFVFPGQGSQKVGMGRALAEAYPECRAVFDEADAALGEPLSHLCFDGPEDRLVLTENTQPAILTVSIAAARLLETARASGLRSSRATASGEYSAHVAAGTFAFADAVRIVRRRGPLHAGGRAGGHRRDGGGARPGGATRWRRLARKPRRARSWRRQT